MLKKIFSLFFILGLFFILYSPVFAVTFVNPIATGRSASTTFDQVLDRMIGWIFPVSLVIAILMIIIGAYYFLFSGGDPEKASTGKRVITYALIGVVVVVLAKGTVNFFRRVFPANTTPEELLPTTITWLFGILLVSSILVFIIAGYSLITSSGDPEKARKAKQWLIYAVIGLAVAVLSRGIVLLVLRIVW